MGCAVFRHKAIEYRIRMIKLPQAFALISLALAPTAVPAAADPIADFYSGKNVQLVIGYAPGGGYDIYARTLARHIGRHIPGNPAIVVQNMPGAGSIKAANYLYNIAPKDGTAFGGFSRGAFLDPLLGRTDGVQYAAAKYGWLGSISNEVGVCAFRSETNIATWADMLAKPYVIGSTGAGADSDVFPTVLRQMFHLPMKVVTGYRSAADVVLAITRKEVDGRCGWSWSSMMAWNKSMYQSKAIRVALQLGAERLPELADVPTILDVAQDADQRAALRLIVSRQTMARPYVAPPGIPPERLKTLRAAFDATLTDPEFLADAQRQDLEVRPVSGLKADELIKEVYASPPAVVKLAIDVMKETN
jgi:tripartite-type tricarboxylate transporter receptor subunit TctC